METVDAAVVLYPRFTTLVGSVNPATLFDFPTAPLDVSRHSGIQFQLWTGSFSGGSARVFLEESLDGQTWVLGPGAASGVDLLGNDSRFFSYSFRLRWFRARMQLTGAASPIVTCWAAGLLRGGGSGVWAVERPTGGAVASRAAGAVTPPAFGKGGAWAAGSGVGDDSNGGGKGAPPRALPQVVRLESQGGAPGAVQPGQGASLDATAAALALVSGMDSGSIDHFLRMAAKAGK
jgi:hypothetical protein